MLVTGKAFRRFLKILVPLYPSILTHNVSLCLLLECGPLFRVDIWSYASISHLQCYMITEGRFTKVSESSKMVLVLFSQNEDSVVQL